MLPPLPEPACCNRDLFTDEITQTFYTESQLLAHQAAVVEACAEYFEATPEVEMFGDAIANAIRSLLK